MENKLEEYKESYQRTLDLIDFVDSMRNFKIFNNFNNMDIEILHIVDWDDIDKMAVINLNDTDRLFISDVKSLDGDFFTLQDDDDIFIEGSKEEIYNILKAANSYEELVKNYP